MRSTWLRSGTRPIGLREGATAHEALFDYVRSLGCRDEEIMQLPARCAPGEVRSTGRCGCPAGCSRTDAPAERDCSGLPGSVRR